MDAEPLRIPLSLDLQRLAHNALVHRRLAPAVLLNLEFQGVEVHVGKRRLGRRLELGRRGTLDRRGGRRRAGPSRATPRGSGFRGGSSRRRTAAQRCRRAQTSLPSCVTRNDSAALSSQSSAIRRYSRPPLSGRPPDAPHLAVTIAGTNRSRQCTARLAGLVSVARSFGPSCLNLPTSRRPPASAAETLNSAACHELLPRGTTIRSS